MTNQFIIMADIIDSRMPGDSNHWMQSFQALVIHMNQHHKSRIASPLTVTIGDEFQGIVKNLGAG
ncbi:MAG: SatD family protein, partial [Bacteroidota bacterium]